MLVSYFSIQNKMKLCKVSDSTLKIELANESEIFYISQNTRRGNNKHILTATYRYRPPQAYIFPPESKEVEENSPFIFSSLKSWDLGYVGYVYCEPTFSMQNLERDNAGRSTEPSASSG